MTAKRSPLAQALASQLHARDLAQEDGGLVRYAERLAKKRERAAVPMAHLSPVADVFERAHHAALGQGPPVFAVVHAPVRHGKTTLVQAAMLRLLRADPSALIAYASYASDIAEEKSWNVRELAPFEGVQISDTFDKREEWRTSKGGGVKAAGITGPWTGRGFRWIVIDDPYRDGEQAESAAHRHKIVSRFDDSLWTRREPGETSIIVIAARWHPHDLSGELVRRGWEYVCLPAIDDDGAPLWPERWPLPELLRTRDGDPTTGMLGVSARVWWALYQGNPRPEQGRVFDPSHLATYDALPGGAFVEVGGLDLAYGAKARHDRSALVFFRRYTAEPRCLYLVEAQSRQEGIELSACRVAEAQIRRGGSLGPGKGLALPSSAAEIEARWRPQLARPEVRSARRVAVRWATSTTEAGTAALLQGYGAMVEAVRAAVDKKARAEAGGYTAAWAEGRIRVPIGGGEAFDRWRIEHEDFTGFDGGADDYVDASVAAHDAHRIPVAGLGGGAGRLLGERAWGGERCA